MWQNVATLNQVKENKMMRIVIEGTAILLTFHNDRVYAMNDKCPHMGASLVKGTLVDGIVTCASHHAKIDITNGQIVSNPKILFVKLPANNAKTYQTKIKDGNVLVDM